MIEKSPEDSAEPDNLARDLMELTERDFVDCERAANYLRRAWEIASRVRQSLPYWKGQPTAKEQRRALCRLTRKRPRNDAVSALSHQSDFLLERALLRRGEWTRDWRQRPVRDLASAATEAINRAVRQGTRPGRPPDHAMTEFIATAAHIAETVLGIQPSGAPGSVFRRVMASCAGEFGIHMQELQLNESGAPRTLAAIEAYRNKTLPNGLSVYVVKRSSVIKGKRDR